MQNFLCLTVRDIRNSFALSDNSLASAVRPFDKVVSRRSNGRMTVTGKNEVLGDELVPVPPGGPVSNPASAVTAWRLTAVAMTGGMLTVQL